MVALALIFPDRGETVPPLFQKVCVGGVLCVGYVGCFVLCVVCVLCCWVLGSVCCVWGFAVFSVLGLLCLAFFSCGFCLGFCLPCFVSRVLCLAAK